MKNESKPTHDAPASPLKNGGNENPSCTCGHTKFWHADFGKGACGECSCIIFVDACPAPASPTPQMGYAGTYRTQPPMKYFADAASASTESPTAQLGKHQLSKCPKCGKQTLGLYLDIEDDSHYRCESALCDYSGLAAEPAPRPPQGKCCAGGNFDEPHDCEKSNPLAPRPPVDQGKLMSAEEFYNSLIEPYFMCEDSADLPKGRRVMSLSKVLRLAEAYAEYRLKRVTP